MKAVVVVFPGTNRERDVAAAIVRAGGKAEFVWHDETALPRADLIVLPGGFAHGDYLRCGAMAARSAVIPEVVRRAGAGVPVLGICNGFQVLTETGLLPGALLRNAGLKFICRDVHLRVETARSGFTQAYAQGQVLRVPVAHHDGNYFADADTIARLKDADRVAFRYCGADGTITAAANPNGSLENIAGILNERRNVLGMMPHPENLTDPAQGGTDGLGLFRSLVETVA
ncbi:MAG: phosphoribosylformylglycinamidine synthase subunit PurQ [Alphaproteobacteria bacterium]|nr:phosphoribosylformylglycinamidine synthase subunit PurQ [Alphaproteobacteria bacterium]MDX5368641.1 phosphoribosylformylglycinamidine synthase subunit PurQ [Alphaproteobacteria bacterium]MDX5463386.1 phosphoribosylformylglycinamidine synthase subunit PurQ [Alphaproteobacteria bacterium]